jgi:hypothetical protein
MFLQAEGQAGKCWFGLSQAPEASMARAGVHEAPAHAIIFDADNERNLHCMGNKMKRWSSDVLTASLASAKKLCAKHVTRQIVTTCRQYASHDRYAKLGSSLLLGKQLHRRCLAESKDWAFQIVASSQNGRRDSVVVICHARTGDRMRHGGGKSDDVAT